MIQKCTSGSAQGATPTWTPDSQKRSTTASPSPKKTRSQSSPAKPKDDMTSDGPTIADLTAMVQQLRLENKHLEDHRLLCRGLSAKMKHLFEATGHKDLY